MGTVVIGLDPSSKKIALSISVDGGPPLLRHRILAAGNVPHACLQSFRYVRDVVREYRAQGHRVFIFIEEPVVGRGGVRSTLSQTKTHGAMLAGAQSGGAFVSSVNNQSWKKRVVGSGNAGKPQIKQWVAENWPYLLQEAKGDQDLIDAGCIMKYGLDVVKTRDRIASGEVNLEDVDIRSARTRTKKEK